MKTIKTIAIDIDGVVGDVLTPWLNRYNHHYHDNITPKDISEWDIHKFLKPECGLKIYDYLNDPHLYDDVIPYPDTIQYIEKIKELKYRVVWVTSSPAESSGRKFFWLKEYGFITNRKDYVEMTDKSLIRADVLIDDYFVNIDSFVGKGILFSRYWNLSLKNDPRYLYAKDWNDVLEYING